MRKQRKKVRLKKLPTDHTRRTEPFFQSQVPYLRASIFSLPYSYSPDNHWDNSDVEQRVKVRLYCICVASLCCSYYSTKFPPLFVLHLRTDPQFSFFFSLHYKLLRAGFTKLSSFPWAVSPCDLSEPESFTEASFESSRALLLECCIYLKTRTWQDTLTESDDSFCVTRQTPTLQRRFHSLKPVLQCLPLSVTQIATR